jgi:hypothetical protein
MQIADRRPLDQGDDHADGYQADQAEEKDPSALAVARRTDEQEPPTDGEEKQELEPWTGAEIISPGERPQVQRR